MEPIALIEISRGGKKIWRAVGSVDAARGMLPSRVVFLKNLTMDERRIFAASGAHLYDLGEVLEKAWMYDGLNK